MEEKEYLKIYVLAGIPGSGKSSWAKEFISKEPDRWVRVSNDDLRAQFNGSIWSASYENIIGKVRNSIILEALKNNRNVVVDNLNLDDKHWNDILKIGKSSYKNVIIEEKIFYVDLKIAIERDGKREGKACVGEKVIRTWWNKSGKESFKNRISRIETIESEPFKDEKNWRPLEQDMTKQKAIICDLDGTLCAIGNRSPYDASRCDLTDTLKEYVAETVRLYHKAGYKIIFCSGREDKDEPPTRRFIENHLPDMEYTLMMRKSGDKRADNIIKEEIFDQHIFGKYYIHMVLDDRLSVSRMWYRKGLNLARIGNPDADF